MDVNINIILRDVFGFESKRVWEVNEKGIVEAFPVRFLIEKGKMNGLVFRGVEKSDEGFVYLYEFIDGDEKIKDIRVVERNRRVVLEFEYDGKKFRFVEFC